WQSHSAVSYLYCTPRRKLGASIPETTPIFIRRLIAGGHRRLDDGDGAAVLLAQGQADGFIRSVQVGDAPRRWEVRKVPTRDRSETSRRPILFLPSNDSRYRRRRLQRVIQAREIGQHFAVAIPAVVAQP